MEDRAGLGILRAGAAARKARGGDRGAGFAERSRTVKCAPERLRGGAQPTPRCG